MIAPTGGSHADRPLLTPLADPTAGADSCPDCGADLVRTWDAAHVVTDWCPRCSYAEQVHREQAPAYRIGGYADVDASHFEPLVQGGQGRAAPDVVASAFIVAGALALIGLGMLLGHLLAHFDFNPF